MGDPFNGDHLALGIEQRRLLDLHPAAAAILAVDLCIVGRRMFTSHALPGIGLDAIIDGMVSQVLRIVGHKLIWRITQYLFDGGTQVAKNTIGTMGIEEILITQIFDQAAEFLLALSQLIGALLHQRFQPHLHLVQLYMGMDPYQHLFALKRFGNIIHPTQLKTFDTIA